MAGRLSRQPSDVLFYLGSFFSLLLDWEFSLETAAKFYQIVSHNL